MSAYYLVPSSVLVLDINFVYCLQKMFKYNSFYESGIWELLSWTVQAQGFSWGCNQDIAEVAVIWRLNLDRESASKMTYTHGWQLMLASARSLAGADPRHNYHDLSSMAVSRVVRSRTWQLASPKASAPRWQGRSFAFYWRKVTQGHFCHTLLVEVVTCPPRYKGGHGSYLLKGGPLKNLRPCFKASTVMISDGCSN